MLRHVGEALRMLRKLRGYTVPDFAERIGTTAPVIYRYESGRGYPSLRTVFDVLTALETDLHAFQRALDAAAQEETTRQSLLG